MNRHNATSKTTITWQSQLNPITQQKTYGIFEAYQPKLKPHNPNHINRIPQNNTTKNQPKAISITKIQQKFIKSSCKTRLIKKKLNQKTNLETHISVSTSSISLRTLTWWTFIKILRRILRTQHSNLKNQIITTRFNSSNRPPLKQSPNPNSIKFSNLILDDFTPDDLRVQREVVIRRESELAFVSEIDRKFAGSMIERVISDVFREKSDGKSEGFEFLMSWC